jgi:hypothetical protein
MSKKPEYIVIEERHRIMCNRKNNKLKKIIGSSRVMVGKNHP